MAGRSPARFLAPIALIAFAFALYSVVQDAREPAGGNSGDERERDRDADRDRRKKKKKSSSKRKTYTVKSGDTPSGIAEKTGVVARDAEELNPDLDPRRSPRARRSS